MRLPDRRGLALLVLVPACLVPDVASVGGYTLIGDKEMTKVQMIGDASLVADARRLEGKSVAVGSADYYAALCVQEYINARFAEHALPNTPDPSAQATLRGELAQYGHCAAICDAPASAYADLAARYKPLCAQGHAQSRSRDLLDALARAVDAFEHADAPLAMFVAERDCRQMLEQIRRDEPGADVTQQADEIAVLSHKHAADIRAARAFHDSAEARDNLARREALEADRGALEADIGAIEAQQAELTRSGSLDAYMARRQLDDQISAKRRQLAVKDHEAARLADAYQDMARARGLLGASR